MSNFYHVLCISPSASVDEIRHAFRRRALEVHPDKGGSKESFHEVYQAFETLAHTERRQSYDTWLRGESQRRFKVQKLGKRKAPKSSDVKEKKARQTPAKPAKSKSAKARAKPNPGAMRHPACRVSRIWELLGQLSRESRQQVIQDMFSQQQRLLLEKWIMENSARTSYESASGIAVQHTEQQHKQQRQDMQAEDLGNLDGVLPNPVDDDSSDEDQFALEDQRAPTKRTTRRQGRQGPQNRCIHSFCGKNGMTYYYATASFQCIRMQTTTCDLPTALEYVVILTAVKERVLRGVSGNLQQRIEVAFEEVCREHSKSREETVEDGCTLFHRPMEYILVWKEATDVASPSKSQSLG